MGNLFEGSEDRVFKGGSMYIELFENIKSFVSGQQITGTVHLDLQETFDCSNLTLELYGSENVKFYKRHVTHTGVGKNRRRRVRYRWHYGEVPFIRADISLQNFIDGPPRPGQWSYPFTVKLPDWLPASMLLTSKHERAQLSINYHLRAQMTPTFDEGWLNKDNLISGF